MLGPSRLACAAAIVAVLTACAARNDTSGDSTDVADGSGAALTEVEAPEALETEGDNLEPMELAALDDGAGYAVTGPWDFEGTLTTPETEDGAWRFAGQFTFRTGGYEVGEPRVRIMKSYPEQVSIVIPVVPPPDDAMVIQVITETPVEVEIPASPEATFTAAVERVSTG